MGDITAARLHHVTAGHYTSRDGWTVLARPGVGWTLSRGRIWLTAVTLLDARRQIAAHRVGGDLDAWRAREAERRHAGV